MAKDKKHRICVFTGTRAEYGLLYPLLKELKRDKAFDLKIIVSGMHLSPEFGNTYRYIEQDGFHINERIEMLISSDTKTALAKSCGLGIVSYADALDRLKPDAVVVLGDRFEALSMAVASFLKTIPVIHLLGGEATFGVIDEGIRNAITKLSHLHFTATQEYRNRVIQMGENPKRVFCVGSIGLDNIRNLKLYSKKEVKKRLGIEENDWILFTYHPLTLSPEEGLKELRLVLRQLKKASLFVVFTKANADDYGREINKMLQEFCDENPDKAKLYDSLGQKLYLSAMKYALAVVGNSSSGIIEAPSFKVPTVNIGRRQDGRIKANSVIDCEAKDLLVAINKALSVRFRESIANQKNPYGDGKTASRIVKILKRNMPINIRKEFFDLCWI